MAMRGWSRRSRRGTPAVSDAVFASDADENCPGLLRLLQDSGAGSGGAGELSDPVLPRLGLEKRTWANDGELCRRKTGRTPYRVRSTTPEAALLGKTR
jgi:hypothetical protein